MEELTYWTRKYAPPQGACFGVIANYIDLWNHANITFKAESVLDYYNSIIDREDLDRIFRENLFETFLEFVFQ